jgi:very-short-patch-repair endonuclease
MLDIKEIIYQYYTEGKSIREIAEKYQTYPNKIARALKDAGQELRSKAEAGKLAVDSGKIKPPMLGKKRTQKEKDNIGQKRADRWKEMSTEKLEAFKENAKVRWDSRSHEEKIETQRRAGEALRKASTEGSKAEKFLYEQLTRDGYDVIIHKVGLIAGEKFEVDLYLPKLNVAIEIDGPQHFLPVYGEHNLRRNIKYDAIKNGALLTRGLCVIRVKYLLKHSSDSINNKLFQLIKSELAKIEQRFPPEGYRLIELEISND